MKLDFIIVALPRSGTTWASNWLTTDHSICWHDPLSWGTPDEIDSKESSKHYRGIACTGSWMFTSWFENHPAAKIILERDVREVNASLEHIGLPGMTKDMVHAFQSVRGGIRLPYEALWENPEPIWRYLLPALPFDRERHAELSNMLIQPADSPNNTPTLTHLRRVIEELRGETWQLAQELR